MYLIYMSDIVNEIYNEYKKKNKKHKKYEGFTMSDFINEEENEDIDANANANEEEENITFDSLRKEWDMSEPEKLVKESQNTSEKIVWTIGIIIMVLVL